MLKSCVRVFDSPAVDKYKQTKFADLQTRHMYNANIHMYYWSYRARFYRLIEEA